jgi:hypothetical protein
MSRVAPSLREWIPSLAEPQARFATSVRALTARHIRLWWETPSHTPLLGDAVGRRAQKDNARECERLIDEVARRIETYPESEIERRHWRREVKALVQRFGEEHLAWPEGYRALLFDDAFFQTTTAFVRQARAFDAAVRVDELLQALRNVWIANSIQMLLDLPLELRPSVFAYSMLYPYTDNLLDDPRIPPADKNGFSDRLRGRLAGEPVAPANPHERQVFRLVELIEADHPRSECPEVHASLLAIHEAQVASLVQQGGLTGPYENDLLAIGVAKGGTSVLADGYLAAGTLSAEEAEFCFGYGVFLQLIDDLQDVSDDQRAGHATIFSQSAGHWPLDRLASRLFRLIGGVVDESPRFNQPRFAQQKDLIRRNCTFLLVGSIAENPHLFSRPFLRELESCWAFDFASMRRLRRRAAKRYRRATASLRRRYQKDSLLDLLV